MTQAKAELPEVSYGRDNRTGLSDSGPERRVDSHSQLSEDRALSIIFGLKDDLRAVLDRSWIQRVRRDQQEARFGDIQPRVKFRGMEGGLDSKTADNPTNIRLLVSRAMNMVLEKDLADSDGSDYLQAAKLVECRQEFGQLLAGLGEIVHEYGYEPLRFEDEWVYHPGELYSLPASMKKWSIDFDMRLYAYCAGFNQSGVPFFEYNPELIGRRSSVPLGCDTTQMGVGIVGRPELMWADIANVTNMQRLKGYTVDGRPVYEHLGRKVQFLD